MADDLVKLQRQRAQAEQAGDAAAVARFDARIANAGMALQTQDQERLQQGEQPVNPAMDVLKGAGAGVRRGIEGIPGAPGDIAGLGRLGVSKLAQLLGADPETVKAITEYDIPYVPDVSSENIHQLTMPLIGESYQPQTTAGKFAATAGEFAPGFINPLGGAGKVLKDVGKGIIAGVTSEAAGQATAGTALEPWARAAGGIAAGVAPAAAEAGVKAVRGADARQAEIAAEEAARQHGVQLTKGQRSGDVSQQMAEQQMLHGARGGLAQRLMEQRQRASLEAIKDASLGIMDTAAPARAGTPVEAGGALNRMTEARARELMEKGGAGIEQAINQGVMIDAERLRGLPAELQTKLAGDTPFVPDVIIDVNTPVAKQAMDRVSTFIKQAEDPSVAEVSLAGAERLRQQLGTLKAATPEDRRAMAKIMQHFDDWYDDAVAKDARVMPNAGALPGPGGPRDPRDVLSDLIANRGTFKQGADIARPRGKPVGGREVAKIATEGTHPEDTARLFKPNDRGELSSSAIDAIDRMKAVGATSEELDQVRSIVLEQLTTGDPGKVAARVENFTRNNPTAAEMLFDTGIVQRIKDWAATNRRLVPDPKATNPSKSSYGVVGEVAKAARKSAVGQGGTIGAVLGGLPGAVAGATVGAVGAGIDAYKAGRDARRALKPADRSSQFALTAEGGAKGGAKATPGALRGLETVTITDEDDPNYGDRVEIISEGKSGFKVRLPDGTEKIIGKALVK